MHNRIVPNKYLTEDIIFKDNKSMALTITEASKGIKQTLAGNYFKCMQKIE
jgi:hypothetical protein